MVIVSLFVILLLTMLPIASVVESNVVKDRMEQQLATLISEIDFNKLTYQDKNNSREPLFFMVFLLKQLLRIFRIIKLGIILIIIKMILGREPSNDWWSSDWLFRRQITIDHTKVAGDLANFPVLVSYASSVFSNHAQPDGDDFVFVYSNGDEHMQLCHEIEYYDNITGELIAWVNVTYLSADEDTTLYLYYGNPSCTSQQFPEGVWDSNYVMVQHMDIQGSTIIDSTLNNNDGSLVSNPKNIKGVIGNAVQFDGVDDVIEVSYNSTLEPLDLTFELWGKITGPRSDGAPHNYFALKRGGDYWGNNDGHQYSIHGYWDYDTGTRKFRALYERDSSEQQHAVGDSIGTNNTWYHLATTFDETTDIAKFYMNGSLKASESMESEIIWYNEDLGFSWAKDYRAVPHYSNVTVDETRISKIIRSQKWLSTSYKTMSGPSDFLNFGPEETELIISDFNIN